VVNGQSFAIATSPQSVTLTGLTANGAAVSVTASFSADAGCSRTEAALFTAPASCGAPPCAISDLAAGAQTACDSVTNTYTQVVVVTYANPPASGNLVVNGQSFAIGTSPQDVTLTGLTANGAPVSVTARFSADTGCSRTESALFTAPASCGQAGGLDCSDAEASRELLCPPNHKFKRVHIEDVEGADDDDLEITITRVTSDEPVDGNGDGSTCPDAVINGDGSVDLRAERAGNGNGRVYTIDFTATDETGASCTGTVFVCVPHDARGHDDDDDGDDGDDDDDDLRAGPIASKIVIWDRDHDRDRDRDHDRDGDHDGDHDRDGCGHGERGSCIRDDVQYDATVCPISRQNVPVPAAPAGPIVTRSGGGSVTIQFTTAARGPVDLRIFDLRGRLVRSVVAEDFAAGQHALRWDGRDANGHEAASGIYLVRMVAAGKPYTAKTVWMR